MNSRTNSGRGFQIPLENDFWIGGPLVPPTLGNPILPRSNVVPIERTNWHDLVGIPDRHLRETMNSGEIGRNLDLNGLMGQNVNCCESGFPRARNGCFDQNVGSYAQNFGNDNPLAELFTMKKAAAMSVGSSANVTASKNMNTANTPAILDSYSQVDSSWTEGNFTSLLLGGESPNPGLNHWIEPDGLPQMPGARKSEQGDSSKGKEPLESEIPEVGVFEKEMKGLMAQMVKSIQTLHTKIDNMALHLLFIEKKLKKLTKEVQKGKIPMDDRSSTDKEEEKENQKERGEKKTEKNKEQEHEREGTVQERVKGNKDDSSETESDASHILIRRKSQRLGHLSKFSNTATTALELSHSPSSSPSTPIHDPHTSTPHTTSPPPPL
ncbi:hypothetical protein Acr_22g0005760 [Actinidia rufa]|uniref:Uncharacterized protein n=1 Tax=Actinidia rufa TaxID=165716 RepID=A0A7J0GKA8_9ERIC|nr:hypothetical protein Acr_22g0005760 [Actinidia rufa]